MKDIIPQERIESKIFLIRGQKVILDVDLANLYGVKTFVLNQAVKRNIERFPDDFMFQLSKEETNILKSQFVISSWGGRRTFPYAFTEQGIAMLSGILNSKRAIHVNIMIMRTFIRLKQMITTHKELAHKIEELERKYKKHDIEIETIFGAIKKMLEPPKSPPRKFGFQP
ncbi:ORF6N domain-containing protein [Candidatus Saganbacteria bacterium]|nr:ORF6N domain-containing protein [Candidatus Saganbacteria bacterium]